MSPGMSLQGDLNINVTKFDRNSYTEKTKAVNEKLIKVQSQVPLWWEVGAAKYREMRKNGETPLPKPTYLPQAQKMTVPSREAERDIPIRIFKPSNGVNKGILYHIHGGGWVLQDEATQDPLLEFFAESLSLTVVSVGYRLAPEHPWPSGPMDCYDVGEWLVDNAEEKLGSPLMAGCGESAGGHLTALTCFHLQKSRPSFNYKALLFNFAAFDISNFLPQCHNYQTPLVLTGRIMEKYIEALLPGTTADQRTSPDISPFYADLHKLRLPPALFAIGTEDPLLEDSVFMAARWQMARGQAVLKVYPGAPHGFCLFEDEAAEYVRQYKKDVAEVLGAFLE